MMVSTWSESCRLVLVPEAIAATQVAEGIGDDAREGRTSDAAADRQLRHSADEQVYVLDVTVYTTAPVGSGNTSNNWIGPVSTLSMSED